MPGRRLGRDRGGRKASAGAAFRLLAQLIAMVNFLCLKSARYIVYPHWFLKRTVSS